jgi:hypothetical protein
MGFDAALEETALTFDEEVEKLTEAESVCKMERQEADIIMLN